MRFETCVFVLLAVVSGWAVLVDGRYRPICEDTKSCYKPTRRPRVDPEIPDWKPTPRPNPLPGPEPDDSGDEKDKRPPLSPDDLAVNASFIRLYEEVDFSGLKYDKSIRSSGCQDIETPISSAVTYGACITFYERRGCTGSSSKVTPKAGFYFYDLRRTAGTSAVTWDVSKGAYSFAPCHESSSAPTPAVKWYSAPKRAGKWVEGLWLDFNCRETRMADSNFGSIDTDNTCVQLFPDRDCTGDGIKIFPGSQNPDSFDSKTKYPGTEVPVLNNVKGIKRCRVSAAELMAKPVNSNIDIMQTDGNLITIDASLTDTCTTLYTPVNYVNTNGNCLQFFESLTCTGASRKLFKTGDTARSPDLSYYLMPPSTSQTIASSRSVRPCLLP